MEDIGIEKEAQSIEIATARHRRSGFAVRAGPSVWPGPLCLSGERGRPGHARPRSLATSRPELSIFVLAPDPAARCVWQH